MPRSQARPGDATAREKERLEKQHRPEIEKAATTTALTNPPVVERVDTVVDYTAGGSASAEEAEAQPAISMEQALADNDTEYTQRDMPLSMLTDADIAQMPDGRTDVRPLTIERPEEPQPVAENARAQAQPRQVPVVERAAAPKVEKVFRLMEVNTDLPDVTIGKDNHFTFREGTRYKVPQYVYDHLDEKGYVRH